MIPPALEGLEVELFATCARGTEVPLKEELRELRFFQPKADRGGVRFRGRLEHAFLACLESRIAVRILVPMAVFRAAEEGALYAGVRSVDWTPLFGGERTLRVSATSKDSRLTHTNYIAQKTKDAIVDQLRDRHGSRPDVDAKDADVAIFVHLKKDEARVYLDASGTSLHERGWRQAIGQAPLKETLAAAMLRLSGWDRERSLVDPLCGAGTIPIEADLWARDVAPGLARPRFGIERWAVIDETLRLRFAELRGTARARMRREGPTILASDRDPLVVAAASSNVERAGSRVRPVVADLARRMLPQGSLVIANPPYGVRLEEDRLLLHTLRERLAEARPARVALLLPEEHDRSLLPRSAERHPLMNGDLACELCVFDVSA